MHETLVIAPTTRVASHIARWHYLKENRNEDMRVGFHHAITADRARRYDWCPADGALQAMVGASLDRIVIVDYPKWHSWIPGDIAALATEIDRRVLAGAERVWWK